MVLKDNIHSITKKNHKKFDYFLIILKLIILIEDITDFRSFFIQLQLIKNKSHLLPSLRQRVVNLYFF